MRNETSAEFILSGDETPCARQTQRKEHNITNVDTKDSFLFMSSMANSVQFLHVSTLWPVLKIILGVFDLQTKHSTLSVRQIHCQIVSILRPNSHQ